MSDQAVSEIVDEGGSGELEPQGTDSSPFSPFRGVAATTQEAGALEEAAQDEATEEAPGREVRFSGVELVRAPAPSGEMLVSGVEAKPRDLWPSEPFRNESSGPSSTEGKAPEVRGVVGVGASAGGLEALEEFFAHMPTDTDLAFVVVQHLSPDFKSLMDELLARRTRMAVHRVEHNMRLEPNVIYVIPPKKELRLAGDRLLLQDRNGTASLALPIDVFLESLAEAAGPRAVAVVLSGSGSDGSRGVRAVHERGGAVLVQRPDTAKFDGMPRSAIDSGVVDSLGSPAELPQLLLRALRQGGPDTSPDSAGEGSPRMRSILALLRREHGLDFSNYKPTTIRRRIERRLMLRRFTEVQEYYEFLCRHPEEVQALYWDLLIGVTKFFRDAEAFQILREQMIPELVSRADLGEELRIWVAGCATGEEAYSLAILLREEIEACGKPQRVKIFATDVHRTSLEIAAAGRYSRESLSEVDSERVRRHFRPLGTEYQVVPELRHMVVFAPHDVLRDAPFTKLDLVTCRNLLIYLKPAAQSQALSLMHFGLKTGGLLFLGPSETPGTLASAFKTLHRHWKIYRKERELAGSPHLELSAARTSNGAHPSTRVAPQETRLQRAHQALALRYAPPSILVGPDFQVLQTFAGGGDWLGHQDGKPSLNILDMLESELKLTINAALQRVQRTRLPASYSNVRTGNSQVVQLQVEPVYDAAGTCFLISILEQKERPPEPDFPRANIPEISRRRIAELEEELQYTKENLQATLEEMETANEELQSTNEELVASNEELQSTNEELHSVNEELYTVNAEHQRKIDQLSELTEDMENLFSATDVGTVFLDRALRIRRFTPKIAELFQFLPQDVGRPIASFAYTMKIPELMEDLSRVVTEETPCERQAQGVSGRWYLLRAVPYRIGTAVDGAVLSLVDITTLKETESRLRLMSRVFKEVADPVIVENLAGEIIDLNPEAERVYGYRRDELLGKSGLILVPEDRRDEDRLLRRECQEHEYVRNAETARRDKNGEIHPVLVTLSRISTGEGEPPVVAIIGKDITLRKQAEQAAREAVRKRDEFLAMLSHELRNPLGVVQNAAELLSRDEAASSQASEIVRRCHAVIRRQVAHMASLLGDLLDVSRVTQGKVELQRTPIDLQDTLGEAVEAVEGVIERRGQHLDVSAFTRPIPVLGDRARLRQIQENLLTNASKYTPPGGSIGVSLAREGHQAVIRVSDTGRGIPPDRLESIFDLFTQVDFHLDRTDGGMGVGLTLVRSLVELHGGSVRAHSEGLGRGSVFEVRLPIMAVGDNGTRPGSPGAAARPGAGSNPGPDPAAALGREVLIVEDNSDARETLQAVLELEGHRVRVARDGVEGLQAMEQHLPEVALVDIGLPGVDGYELARRVRARHGDSIRLIALTGYGRPEDRKAVEEAGFNLHLVKPVSPDRLLQALRWPTAMLDGGPLVTQTGAEGGQHVDAAALARPGSAGG